MKLFILILFLTILTLSNLYAQNDSYTFYYPLNVGDYWEYEYRVSPTLSYIESRKVIGDTLMPNGNTYRILKTDFPLSGTIYQRIVDSTYVYQFYHRFEPPDQVIYDEFLLYKLDVEVGDTWPYPPGNYDGFISDSGFVEVTQIADTTIWSDTFKFAILGSFTLPDTGYWFGEDVFLVDNIGVLEDSFEGGFYRLLGAIIKGKQHGTITSIKSYENDLSVKMIEIFHNYPNPFNSSTTIEYRLNNSGRVRISIFNVLGERVKILLDSFQTPGLYRITWTGVNDSGLSVASGIYIYLLEINGVIAEKRKMSFLK